MEATNEEVVKIIAERNIVQHSKEQVKHLRALETDQYYMIQENQW